MNKIKLILLTFMFLIVSYVWCQSESPKLTDDDAETIVSDGIKLIADEKSAEAISECFDKIILSLESTQKDSTKQIYCSRGREETMLYLLMAAKDNIAAEVLSSVWSEAYFFKGVALVNLGRIPEAKQYLEQTLVFSPNNSQYLSELGYIYQTEKNWAKSLELFMAAEEAAISFSPEESKKLELGRARRGLGYTFIEMGQIDKAEEKYRQCVEADPTDDKAKAELEYIRKLKSKTNDLGKQN